MGLALLLALQRLQWLRLVLGPARVWVPRAHAGPAALPQVEAVVGAVGAWRVMDDLWAWDLQVALQVRPR